MSFMELKRSTSFDNKRQQGGAAALTSNVVAPVASIPAPAPPPPPKWTTTLPSSTSIGIKKNRRFNNDLDKNDLNNTTSTNNTTTSTNSTKSRNDRRKYKRKSIVKQYKGKRDPSTPMTNVKLQHLNLINREIGGENPHHLHQNINKTNEQEVIDLDSSTTSSSATVLLKDLDLPVINIASSSATSSSSSATASSSTTSTSLSKTTTSIRSPAPLSQRAINRRMHRGGGVGLLATIQRREKNHRHKKQRKQLKESSLAAITKNCPCMTSLERVLNWKISDEFLEVEEFSSCVDGNGAGNLKPYRRDSQLVNKKYSTELKLPQEELAPVSISPKSSPALKKIVNKATPSMIKSPLNNYLQQKQQNQYRVLKSNKKKSYLIGRNDGGGAGATGGNVDDGNSQVKSSIQLRVDYASKYLTKPTTDTVEPIITTTSNTRNSKLAKKTIISSSGSDDGDGKRPISRSTIFKVPETPALKSPTVTQTLITSTPTTTTTTPPTTVTLKFAPEPVTIIENNLLGHEDKSEIKPEEQQQMSQPANTNSKEEFCKYLRIDINPQNNHDRLKNIDPMDQFKRRSLRVKVQRIAMNNMAKYIKEIEIEKKKCDELEQLSYGNMMCSGNGGGGATGSIGDGTCTNNNNSGGGGSGDIGGGNCGGGCGGNGLGGNCLGNIRRSKKRYKLISAKKPSNKKKIDFMESSMYITAMIQQQQQEILLNNCRSNLFTTSSTTNTTPAAAATASTVNKSTKCIDIENLNNTEIDKKDLPAEPSFKQNYDDTNPIKRPSNNSPGVVDTSDDAIVTSLINRKYRKKSSETNSLQKVTSSEQQQQQCKPPTPSPVSLAEPLKTYSQSPQKISKNCITPTNEKISTLSSGMIKITYPKDELEKISNRTKTPTPAPRRNSNYKSIDLIGGITENVDSSVSARKALRNNEENKLRHSFCSIRSRGSVSGVTIISDAASRQSDKLTPIGGDIAKHEETNNRNAGSCLIRRDYGNNTFDNVSHGKISEISASTSWRYKSKILATSSNEANSTKIMRQIKLPQTITNNPQSKIIEKIPTTLMPPNTRLNSLDQQNKKPTRNEVKKSISNIFKKITKKTNNKLTSTLEKIPNVIVASTKENKVLSSSSSSSSSPPPSLEPTPTIPSPSDGGIDGKTPSKKLPSNKKLKKSHSVTLFEQQAALSQLNQLGIVNSTNSLINLNNFHTTTAAVAATTTTVAATSTMTTLTTPVIISEISNQIDVNQIDNQNICQDESNMKKQSNFQKFFRLGSYKNLKNRIGPLVMPSTSSSTSFRFRNRRDRTVKPSKLLKQQLLLNKKLKPSKLFLLSSAAAEAATVTTKSSEIQTKTATTTMTPSPVQLQSSKLLKLPQLRKQQEQEPSTLKPSLTTPSTSNHHIDLVNVNKVHDHTYHFVSSHAIDSTTPTKSNIIKQSVEQTPPNSPNFEDGLRYTPNLLDRNTMASIVSSTTRLINVTPTNYNNNNNNSTDEDEPALTASGSVAGIVNLGLFDQTINSTDINNSTLTELNLPLPEKCITSNAIRSSSIAITDTTTTAAASTTPINSTNTMINPKITTQIPRLNILLNSNPLKCDMGPVLAALYTNNTIIIVQELEISFWKYPCRIYNIFGMPQQWELIGCSPRDTSDIEIETPYQNRLCSFGSGETNGGGDIINQRPAYVEFRAKQFSPTETRECFVSSIYLNVYFIDERTLEPIVNHVDLDKIMGMANSVRYTVLSNSRYFVMSWMEQAINRSRTGVCKYSLSTEFDTLDSVQEFPYLQHSLKSLMGFNENNLLGFGYSVVTMWDHRTGDLILNIDIDLPIGNNLGCFMANEHENGDRYMFLAQHFNGAVSGNGDTVNLATTQYFKLMAINLTDCFSWKVIQTHELPSNFDCAISTSIFLDNLAVTFRNGESLLLNLYNPRMIYLRNGNCCVNTNTKSQCSQQQQQLLQPPLPQLQQLFVQNDKMFQIMENQIFIKTIYEHFLESNVSATLNTLNNIN